MDTGTIIIISISNRLLTGNINTSSRLHINEGIGKEISFGRFSLTISNTQHL